MSDLLNRARTILGAAAFPVDASKPTSIEDFYNKALAPVGWPSRALDEMARAAGPDTGEPVEGARGRALWTGFKAGVGLPPESEEASLEALRRRKGLLARAARALSSFGNTLGPAAMQAATDPATLLKMGPLGPVFWPGMAKEAAYGIEDTAVAIGRGLDAPGGINPEEVGEAAGSIAVPALMLGAGMKGHLSPRGAIERPTEPSRINTPLESAILDLAQKVKAARPTAANVARIGPLEENAYGKAVGRPGSVEATVDPARILKEAEDRADLIGLKGEARAAHVAASSALLTREAVLHEASHGPGGGHGADFAARAEDLRQVLGRDYDAAVGRIRAAYKAQSTSSPVLTPPPDLVEHGPEPAPVDRGQVEAARDFLRSKGVPDEELVGQTERQIVDTARVLAGVQQQPVAAPVAAPEEIPYTPLDQLTPEMRDLKDPRWNREAGAASLEALVPKGRSGLGNLMRAGVAGRFPVVARNVVSGARMMGADAILTQPLAMADAARKAAEAAHPREKAYFEKKARIYRNTLYSYPGATWNSLWTTLAHAVTETGLRPAGQGAGRMGRRTGMVKALEGMGLPEMAQRLEGLSNPDVTAKTPIEKGLMLLNILSDQFFITSVIDSRLRALETEYGVTSPQELVEKARSLKEGAFIKEIMANAGTDALRIAWNLPAAKGGWAHWWVKNPIINNVAVSPFANAFFSNMLPNIAEKMPFMNRWSRRYQLSMEHEELRQKQQTLRDEMAAMKRQGRIQRGAPPGFEIDIGPTVTLDDQVAKAKEMQAVQRRMRELKKEGIYSAESLRARSLHGPIMIAAAAAIRMARGDDDTDYDEIPAGPGKVGNIRQHLGEDAPYVLLGDVIARTAMGSTRYSGDADHLPVWPAKVLDAISGSRYGTDPGFDIFTSLAKGDAMSWDFLNDMGARLASNLGAMTTAGGWPLDVARWIESRMNPAEVGVARTTKPNPDASFLANAAMGAVSNIPVARNLLPPSPDWLQGKERARVVTGPVGQSIRERGPLEAKLLRHQGEIDYGQVSPHMTGDRIYDGLVLKYFGELTRNYVLPDIANLADPKDFRDRMQEARREAQNEAILDYIDQTGKVPTKIIKKVMKDEEERERRENLGESGMPQTSISRQELLPPPE